MTHAIQSDVGLMADGTTDVDVIEQFSIIVRYVDVEHFEVHDAFLGMHNPPSTVLQMT